MRVLVVGAGWVGIIMSILLSSKHEVTILDIDEKKIEKIKKCESPIEEPGLSDELQKSVKNTSIRAVLPTESIGTQDVVLICVGTPRTSDGSVELQFVESAIKMIMENLDDICDNYCVIAIKSTVPPGTTRILLIDPLQQQKELRTKVGIVFNPEFLREGSALRDARNPDRIIIGTTDEKASELVQKMYDQCIENTKIPYMMMSPESAELCKYASNAFLATKISFANEIADVAESLPNTDIADVMAGVVADHRISPSYFGSGAGYGGSCFPKDIQGLVKFANKKSLDMPLLRATQLVNSRRPQKLVDMLVEEIGDIHDKKIALLGLAFKPGTNDIRESPTLKIIEILSNKGAKLHIHDPLSSAMTLVSQKEEKVMLTENLESCLTDASGCILVTDWPIYSKMGLTNLTKFMSKKIFIDGRRVFTNHTIPDDVCYRSIGLSKKGV